MKTAASVGQRVYFKAFLIRSVEETLLALFGRGLVRGTVHTCVGEEVGQVALIDALQPDLDIVFSNHRGHGHFLAFGGPVRGLVAEVMGRATGVCGGIGGTQHLHAGNFYSNGIQGGIGPNAVGAALAEKLRGSDAVVTVFLGDGTMGQGATYESFNLASLWNLRVLFVLEDNGIAQTTPRSLAHAGDLRTRAQSFGIRSESIEAGDVFGLHRLGGEIVTGMRRESRPAFLHVDTYRLRAHSKGDDTRDEQELQALRQKDPLPRLRGTVISEIGEGACARQEGEILRYLDEVVEECAAHPEPSYRDFASSWDRC